MQLDSTAAAYGLIQVVFADATERLAYALFTLQRRRKAVTFEEILSRNFSHILKAFKVELKQFEREQSVAAELKDVRDACEQLDTLSQWRNERIHARVKWVENGMALYNSKMRQRLSISYPECDEIIHKLAYIISTLATCLPKLINVLDFDETFDAFFKNEFTT